MELVMTTNTSLPMKYEPTGVVLLVVVKFKAT